MSTVRLNIELDRLLKYADPDETVGELTARALLDSRTGGRVVWTRNYANVGTIETDHDPRETPDDGWCRCPRAHAHRPAPDCPRPL